MNKILEKMILEEIMLENDGSPPPDYKERVADVFGNQMANNADTLKIIWSLYGNTLEQYKSNPSHLQAVRTLGGDNEKIDNEDFEILGQAAEQNPDWKQTENPWDDLLSAASQISNREDSSTQTDDQPQTSDSEQTDDQQDGEEQEPEFQIDQEFTKQLREFSQQWENAEFYEEEYNIVKGLYNLILKKIKELRPSQPSERRTARRLGENTQQSESFDIGSIKAMTRIFIDRYKKSVKTLDAYIEALNGVNDYGNQEKNDKFRKTIKELFEAGKRFEKVLNPFITESTEEQPSPKDLINGFIEKITIEFTLEDDDDKEDYIEKLQDLFNYLRTKIIPLYPEVKPFSSTGRYDQEDLVNYKEEYDKLYKTLLKRPLAILNSFLRSRDPRPDVAKDVFKELIQGITAFTSSATNLFGFGDDFLSSEEPRVQIDEPITIPTVRTAPSPSASTTAGAPRTPGRGGGGGATTTTDPDGGGGEFTPQQEATLRFLEVNDVDNAFKGDYMRFLDWLQTYTEEEQTGTVLTENKENKERQILIEQLLEKAQDDGVIFSIPANKMENFAVLLRNLESSLKGKDDFDKFFPLQKAIDKLGKEAEQERNTEVNKELLKKLYDARKNFKKVINAEQFREKLNILFSDKKFDKIRSKLGFFEENKRLNESIGGSILIGLIIGKAVTNFRTKGKKPENVLSDLRKKVSISGSNKVKDISKAKSVLSAYEAIINMDNDLTDLLSKSIDDYKNALASMFNSYMEKTENGNGRDFISILYYLNKNDVINKLKEEKEELKNAINNTSPEPEQEEPEQEEQEAEQEEAEQEEETSRSREIILMDPEQIEMYEEQIQRKLEVIIERFINQRKKQWRKRTM